MRVLYKFCIQHYNYYILNLFYNIADEHIDEKMREASISKTVKSGIKTSSNCRFYFFFFYSKLVLQLFFVNTSVSEIYPFKSTHIDGRAARINATRFPDQNHSDYKAEILKVILRAQEADQVVPGRGLLVDIREICIQQKMKSLPVMHSKIIVQEPSEKLLAQW